VSQATKQSAVREKKAHVRKTFGTRNGSLQKGNHQTSDGSTSKEEADRTR